MNKNGKKPETVTHARTHTLCNLEERAITLISLIITIIVLLILAGVALNFVMGENGILRHSETSKQKYELAQAREELELEILKVQTKIMKEESRIATLEDLLNLIDTDKYEIVLYYTPIASNTETQAKATYSKVKEISSGIMFVVDSKLIITDVEIIDKNESLKINNFEVSIENANGSYLTINVSGATTNDESTIQLYKYYVNGEKIQETTENTYTVTELELNTEYSIKVIAVDEDGKEKNSSIKKYTTANVQYLYRNGDTCNTITGGYTDIIGTANIVVENTNDSIKVTGNKTNSWGFICSNKKINIEKFSKMKIDIEDNGNSSGSNFGIMDIARNKEDSYNAGIRVINAWPIGSSGTPRTVKEIDLEEITEDIYIRIGAYGYGKWMQIYNIWLEK